jgi:hypothetical protein
MSWTENIIYCVGCGVEVIWGAFVRNGKPFCCIDCAEGRPCQCAETMELDDDYRKIQQPKGGLIISD